MEGILRKLEFDMQALLDADLHLDGHACRGTLTDVLDNELLFLCDPIVVAVNHHVDKVSKPHNDAIVALKLLLDAIECKIVGHVIR